MSYRKDVYAGTGGVYSWTAPAGLTDNSIQVLVYGAPGAGYLGGYGAEVVGAITVAPGDILTLYVGDNAGHGYHVGGAGEAAGNAPGDNGGGSSAVLKGATVLFEAAGGGGSGGHVFNGAGGFGGYGGQGGQLGGDGGTWTGGSGLWGGAGAGGGGHGGPGQNAPTAHGSTQGATAIRGAAHSWGAADAGKNHGGGGGAGGDSYADSTVSGVVFADAHSASYGQIQIVSQVPPPIPTIVSPPSGGTVSTDLPTLSASCTTDTSNTPVQAEFEIAADVNFTTGVRTFQEATFTTTHTASLTVDQANGLTAGTWYIRVRATDNMGDISAWSPAQTFVVSHPPQAIPQSPANGQSISYGVSTPLSWLFSSTSPTDYQTAYQVQVQDASTDAVIYDSGVVTSSSLTANVTLDVSQKGKSLRWSASLTDRDGVVGGFVTWQTFQVVDGPAVQVLFPINGAVVSDPTPAIEWTYIDPTGASQSQYKVDLAKSWQPTVISWTTDWQPGTQLTYLLPTGVVTNGESYILTVTIRDTNNLQGLGTTAFTVQYTPPAGVTPTVDASDFDALGYVTVTWPTDTIDPAFNSWRVYRALTGSSTWTLLADIADFTVGTFQDMLAGGSTTYDYAVVQTITEFGSIVESTRNRVSVTPQGSKYWLISAVDPTLSIILSSVSDDKFKDNYESATMNIWNVGRRREFGPHWGVDGSLTAQIRDVANFGLSPAFAALKLMKAQKSDLFLRTPFGDIYQVAIDDLDVTRIAGVGNREWVDVSIAYTEVSTS